MNYDIRTGPEGVWGVLGLAAATLTGWALLGWTDMDAVTVIPLAGAAGSVVRPVLAYVISFLPQRTVTE
jgi:hypothetical protein